MANKILVFAGVVTLIQSMGQVLYCSLALMQYFCVIDFLQELPILIYIRIMYFHNPAFCGGRINIGHAIPAIANQAFVLLTNEPLTAYRTFIINGANLGLATLWIPASIVMITGGAKNSRSKCVRWFWVLVAVPSCVVDLAAVVIYSNDSFYTRTLSDIMEYIGATASGIGNVNLDSTWVAWIMVIVYSRFVILFVINVLLLLMVIVDCNAPIKPVTTGTQVEAPATRTQDTSTSVLEEDETSFAGDTKPLTLIPRPGLSQSFRRMKAYLLNKISTPTPTTVLVERSTSNADSYNASIERSPKAQHTEIDKKRTVNFPENLLSLPQRLENLIAEQQRRLDRAVIDTSGRNSPPRASQSMPQLPSTSEQDEPKGIESRRGTAAELGQMPWAYIPASASRMRDHLPPDEDLPPVPLPDYTAIQPFRKASVHRAASSLSSLLQQKRDLMSTSRHMDGMSGDRGPRYTKNDFHGRPLWLKTR